MDATIILRVPSLLKTGASPGVRWYTSTSSRPRPGWPARSAMTSRRSPRLHKVYLRADGQFLLRWSPVGEDSGYPAITLRPVEQGCACYIAPDIFRVPGQEPVERQAHRRKPAQAGRARTPVTVEALPWLEVIPMRQPAEPRPEGRAQCSSPAE